MGDHQASIGREGLHHRVDRPSEQEADDTEDGGGGCPVAEALLDVEAEVLGHDPEAGVVDVAQSQATEANGNHDEGSLDAAQASIRDGQRQVCDGGAGHDVDCTGSRLAVQLRSGQHHLNHCFSVRSQRSNPDHQDRSHPYLESVREFIFNL